MTEMYPEREFKYVDFAASEGYSAQDNIVNSTESEANLVTSRSATDPNLHYPVLDIDYVAGLVPSSTANHYHLYLDVAVPWYKYRVVLWVLGWAGIVQKGFARKSLKRGFSGVRKPGVYKDTALLFIPNSKVGDPF